MLPGMAGAFSGDDMYEAEKKLYNYEMMVAAMTPEER